MSGLKHFDSSVGSLHNIEVANEFHKRSLVGRIGKALDQKISLCEAEFFHVPLGAIVFTTLVSQKLIFGPLSQLEGVGHQRWQLHLH